MARIKPISIKHNNRTVLETHIEYHPDDKFFFIRIPYDWGQFRFALEKAYPIKQYVRRVSGTVMFADTQDEIESIFRKAAGEFYSSAKDQKKVILYQFHYRTKNLTSAKPRDDRSYGDWDARVTNGNIDLKFDFRVVIRENVGKSVAYFDPEEMTKKESYRRPFISTNSDSLKSEAGRKDEWVEIDYTPEAEEFLLQVYSGLEGIFKKFTAFMGDRDLLLKTLDSKQKLLS